MSGQVRRSGPLQSGICQMEWLSYRSGGHGMFPNFSRLVAVPGGLSDDQVREAITALLIRHEVLRTTFDADEAGWPRQNVRDAVLPPLPTITGRDSAREYVEAPFDIGSEPPIRFGRLTTGDVVFAIAHIASDWTGVSILETDLTELLAAHERRRAACLSDAVPQPIDRAVDERQGRRRARAESALRYWESKLRTFPATVFPTRKGKPAAEMIVASLDSAAVGPALVLFCQAHAASPSSAFMAAVCLALATRFGQSAVGLNVTWSARMSRREQEMVASVFRDMPLCTDLADRPTLSEITRRVRNTLFTSAKHMDFDVMEFHECAARLEVETGRFLGHPEVVNCMIDDLPSKPPEPGCDLRALLADSQASVSRTDDQATGVCHLLIGIFPMPEGLRIRIFVDESDLDEQGAVELARLVEAILVNGAVHGDLTFAAAEQLTENPWRPDSARWAKVEGAWVDLDVISAILGDHPEVHDADVRAEEGRITAYVTADLEPWALRDHVLSRQNGRNAVVSPHCFVVRGGDSAIVTGDGLHRPMLLPRQRAEQVLRDAVAQANALTELSMADTYLTAGGRLHLAPRVLSLLSGAGFHGLTIADLRRPASLAVLAGQMRPT
jgi:hypothetical protein